MFLQAVGHNYFELTLRPWERRSRSNLRGSLLRFRLVLTWSWFICFLRQVMAEKAYIYQADQLLRNYLLADPLVPYTSVLAGIVMSMMAYEVTLLISSLYYKGYSSLTKIQRIEWNNRGMSSTHAILITVISLYLVFFSDLFSNSIDGQVTFRSSSISSFTLGVSVGYFITDLAMIVWLYPSLGGMEYVLHHFLSITTISYTMLAGEGQLYTYMVLISETTTPGINLRWFLDTAGMKKSNAYLINGIMMFIAWLVTRILLFIYLFYNIHLYYDQIRKMHTFGYLLTFVVPIILFIMNMVWFTKILRGLQKTLAKRQ
ncbi:transmembrane protein 56 [Canna indica]|uniref:Transmembrane protein 56 n=1 Tax=Canna indica TaxID=4628 RepID=A0AAQ3JZZ8_9LILI|nr:transmembrane protein 56 [Canna indica]